MGSYKDEAKPNEMRRLTVASSTGGIMTQEVGAITGDLEIATHLLAGSIEVMVRYAEAEEWYAVEGSPIELENASSLSALELEELHESVVSHLTRPGMVVEGNEQATSLQSFTLVADNV